MSKLKIAKDLFDLLYPVGTYYETSNSSWTPSSAGWYGTWVEDTAGKTTVAKDNATFKNLNGSVGTEIVNLSHYHALSGNGYTKLTMHGGGTICYVEVNTPQWNANYQHTGSSGRYISDEIDQWGAALGGTTDSNSLATSVIQPSIVVRRWHRTA